MSDAPLKYVPRAHADDLAPFECTIHRASGSNAARWWLLWFCAPRDSDGITELFAVPVNPLGVYIENGPGGRTWGLSLPPASVQEIAPGTHNWLITPSINVLDTRDAVAGTHHWPSLWHHTPEIIGVPDDEVWTKGQPA